MGSYHRIKNYGDLFIGKGRWPWPMYLLNDKKLLKGIEEKAIQAQNKMKELCKRAANGRQIEGTPTGVQRVWSNLKKEIVTMAKERSKIRIAPLDKKIKEIQSQIDTTLNDDTMDEEEKMLTAAVLGERLKMTMIKKHNRRKETAKAKNHRYAETVCKQWISQNKERKQRDTIRRLRRRGSGEGREGEVSEYVTNSSEMAELARTYHKSLQHEDRVGDQERRKEEIEEVLAKVDVTIRREQKASLARYITKNEVRKAISQQPNGKAPGLDSIPAELYKTLITRGEEKRKRNEPAFEVEETLQMLYKDIEKYGVEENTNFAEGWMCPLYKKKDRADIANYRLITVLNLDYKIFTRALQNKLAKAVPAVIHENQAGFMSGRSIFSQVKTVKLMIDYAEMAQKEGVVVALDQEKAYDKILHDYLWRVLEKYDLPKHFIRTVKSLYEAAETKVIVNGVTSKPFRITRGVRQGDSLSCLLFNLAIETLANLLRKSELKGFRVEGMQERLLTLLFADDTTVFLSKEDNFEHLNNLLRMWCRASRARFNIEKTEIIPVRMEDYRMIVLNKRRINHREDGNKLPEGINIAKEGEMVRILGSQVGNKVEQGNLWGPVLEKIKRSLRHWEHSNSSMKGKRHIINMFVGGMTFYLTRVQGMPKDIEQRITKIIRHYMWEGKKPMINVETLYKPLEEGGRGLLDIKSRNEAIHLSWLKDYMRLDKDRPPWAYMADALIRQNARKVDKIEGRRDGVNQILQTWKAKTRGKTKLPEDLANMLKAGEKNGVGL